MKKTIGILSFILIAAVITGLSFNGCGGKATGAEGTVIAEFNWDGKHQITLEEMQQEIGELPEYKQEQYKDKKGLEEYMTLMAESRLILCLAKDRKLDEDAEILKKVQTYLNELMVDKVTGLEVDQKLKLTEEDYRLYYESHKGDYIDPEQVRLTCITVTNEERAKEVLQEIQDGKDIAEVAKELSDKGELTGPGANPEKPGDTGYMTRSGYPQGAQSFVDAAFATEVGQMNPEIFHVDVQDQHYYMLFRKEEHKQERQKAFDEEDVRRSVERAAEREKRDELMKGWLAQLRERAKVKTYVDRIPETPKPEGEGAEGESSAPTPSTPEEEK